MSRCFGKLMSDKNNLCYQQGSCWHAISKWALLILVFCFFGLQAKSQSIDQFNHIQLDSENDISIVYEICQDTIGFIWAATEEGLVKFNGNKSVYFTEYFGLPENFSSNIKKVKSDSEGNIWICADNKIAKYSFQSNVFEEVFVSNRLSLINDFLFVENKLLVACYNGLWIKDMNSEEEAQKWYKGSPILSLTKLNSKVFIGSRNEVFISDKEINTIDSWLPDYTMNCGIYHDGKYILGTREGKLLSTDIEKDQIDIVFDQNAPINDIVFDESQLTYFVGLDGEGIYQLTEDLEIKNHYVNNVNDEYSLASNGIYDLFIDETNQLWISTYGGGIDVLPNAQGPFQSIAHIPNDRNSILNSFTRAVLEDDNGNVWYGTKTGVSIYFPKSETWKHIETFSNNSTSPIIMTLAEDGNYIWAGTFGNGAYRISKSNYSNTYFGPNATGFRKISLDKVYSICVDSEGTVWLGGIEGDLYYIKNDNQVGSLEINQIREIKESPDGKIYIVGRNGVQFIENEFVSSISELSLENDQLNYSTINAISFDQEWLWIATNGDGIIKYHTRTKDLAVYNQSDGLPSDIIQSILIDDKFIWASSSKGIISFDKTETQPKFQIYDKRDGLLSSSFNYGSYAKFRDGNLAFGGTESVLLIDPSKLTQQEVIPTLVYESIEYPDPKNIEKRITQYLMPINNEKLILNYNQDYINIKYAGINHTGASKTRYQWKMDGIDENWSSPTEKNEINFANLSPGNYAFQVIALNRYNQKSKVNTLSIQITSPWWFSNLAYVIYGLLIILGSIFAFRLAKALIKKRNVEEQVSFYNNITHELKTPISILLSKLNSNSSAEVNVKDIKNTTRRINTLFDQLLNFGKVSSDYYRNQKISKITFQKHLDLIINSFKSEIDKKKLTVEMDNQWPDEFFYYKRDVLDKITYNLISNAVKYSVENGKIEISCQETNDGKLQISVKDDGMGIPKDQQDKILKKYYRGRNVVNSQVPGTGLGLMIVKSLLEYDNGKVYFDSEEGKGTKFTVELSNFYEKYKASEEIVNAEESEENIINGEEKRFKVLVVEDNDELRIDLVEKLSAYYRIYAARNGREGFEKAKDKLPDLIITDFIMPEIDGNELCELLQKNEDTNHIPVFMMTVLNNSSQKIESIKTGVSAYMTKPIDFPFLVAKIDSTLDYKTKLKEKYIKESEISAAGKFKDERESEFIQKLEDFIIEKIGEESFSVQDLCKHIGMSRTAFYMKLTEMIDMSPQNFIINTKMNYARKLLLKGGVTVKEVAFKVGFSNPKYFATSFKKHFGQTPSGFLKSLNPT